MDMPCHTNDELGICVCNIYHSFEVPSDPDSTYLTQMGGTFASARELKMVVSSGDMTTSP